MKLLIALQIQISVVLSVVLFSFCSYTVSGNESFIIEELTSSSSCFTSQAANWQASRLVTNIKYSICGETYLIGGMGVLGVLTASTFNEYFSRYFANLSTHNSIYFSLTIYELGSWDNTDYIALSFDSLELNTGCTGTYFDQATKTDICGGYNRDVRDIHIYGEVPHSTDNLTFKLIMKNNEGSDAESVGFRDMRLRFTTKVLPQPFYPTICAAAPGEKAQGDCSCFEQEFFDGILCRPCDSSCGSCFGPTAQECYRCNNGTRFNGTSCVLCDPSCNTCHGSGADQCDDCPSGSVLLNNNYCVLGNTIVAPLTNTTDSCGKITSTAICNPDEFLYRTSICLGSCEPPLTIITHSSSYRQCHYPCLDQEYFYNNGSCTGVCEYPYKPRNESSILFCDLPCQLGQYLYPDGTCTTSPCLGDMTLLKIDQILICLTKATNSQTPQRIHVIGSMIEILEDACDLGITAARAFTDSDSSSVTVMMLNKILQYIKLINVTHSQNLETVYQRKRFKTGFLPYLPQMTTDMKDHFTSEVIPTQLSKYRLHSNFIINFWDGLLSFAIILGLHIIFISFECITRTRHKTSGLYINSRRARLLTQNFLLLQVYSCYGDIILFLTINVSTIHFTSATSLISFILAITLTVIGIILPILHLKLLLKYRAIKRRPADSHQSLDLFIKQHEGAGVLFHDFKDNMSTNQAYLLFMTLRSVLCSLTIALLYKFPIVQVSLLSFFSVSMLGYCLFRRPLNQTINLIQQAICEVILLIANLCQLGLAIIDFRKLQSITAQEYLSETIIMANLIVTFLVPLFIVIKVIIAIRVFSKRKKVMDSGEAAPKKEERVTVHLSEPTQNINITQTEPSQQVLNPYSQSETAQVDLCASNIIDLSENMSQNERSTAMTKRKKQKPGAVARNETIDLDISASNIIDLTHNINEVSQNERSMTLAKKKARPIVSTKVQRAPQNLLGYEPKEAFDIEGEQEESLDHDKEKETIAKPGVNRKKKIRSRRDKLQNAGIDLNEP